MEKEPGEIGKRGSWIGGEEREEDIWKRGKGIMQG